MVRFNRRGGPPWPPSVEHTKCKSRQSRVWRTRFQPRAATEGRPYSTFKSMSKNRWLCLAVVLIASRSAFAAQDVLHYSATLEPDIAAKSVKGSVRIRFSTDSQQAEFNCGNLAIDAVRLANKPLKFYVHDHHVSISLPSRTTRAQEIDID